MTDEYSTPEEIDSPIEDGREPYQPGPDDEQQGPEPGRDVDTIELEVIDDPRDAIVENYRATRDAEAEESQAESGEELEAPPQPPRRFVTRVDGQTFEVTEDDLIRTFQVSTAADRRLHEATIRLQEANRLMAMAQQQPTAISERGTPEGARQPTSDQPQAPTPPAGPLSKAELMALAETIQLGTTEESAEALAKLANGIAAPQRSVDVSSQVEHALAARDDDVQSTDAMVQFFERYPQLTDEISQGTLVAASRLEMMRDFANKGLPIQGIKMLTPEQLTDMHRRARMQGIPGIRAPHQILEAVGRQPRFAQFVGPPGGQRQMMVNVDRSYRKQMVQPQPALRAAPSRQQQYAPVAPEQRNSDIVAQMRRERGQTVMA